MNRNEIASLALETTGHLLTIVGSVVPNDKAAAGLRLGAALISGIVDALADNEPAEILAKLQSNPLPDIRDAEEEQDRKIEELLRERFG
jgi:hypothetical protein